MGVSLVCAMLVRGSVLNFGLLQDFTVDYLILCVNEGNAKFLISYDNWYYFRIYRFTVIQNDPPVQRDKFVVQLEKQPIR